MYVASMDSKTSFDAARPKHTANIRETNMPMDGSLRQIAKITVMMTFMDGLQQPYSVE